MTHYRKVYSTRNTATPQSEAIPGREGEMALNRAGGATFLLDEWKRLERFLILGSDSNTYYQTARELTLENAQVVRRCLEEDGVRAVNMIVEISEAGRAPKNEPALYALAMAAGLGDGATRARALEVLPLVARTGTHLFHFVHYVEGFRGWGRSLRDAVARWYNEKEPGALAYQVTKYQSRDGWSHRDVLRLAHPRAATATHDAIYHWIVQGWEGVGSDPHPDEGLRLIWALERSRRATAAGEIVALISDYGLTREMIPTEWLSHVEVWEALLVEMPLTAMIRNLAKMTQVGLLVPHSDAARLVVGELRNEERLRRSRVHPIQLLSALELYKQGHGHRGSLTWEPIVPVLDALDEAFYLAFGNVTPSGKATLLGLDVSGSMAFGTIAGVPGLTPRVASAAMALLMASTEPECTIVGFCHEMVPLAISPRQRLDDAIRLVSDLPFGGTDCALPMLWALGYQPVDGTYLSSGGYRRSTERVAEVDSFVIFTDNETWYGQIHPSQALARYREATGRPATLAVVGMTATNFTIADPRDGGMLDVVGFDAAAPQLISEFARGV